MNKPKNINKIQKFESKSMHGQYEFIWDKAENEFVYIKNKKIIDFTSTIFVTNIGHSNKFLVKRVKEALDNKLIHTYNYYNNPRSNYLEKLIKFSKPFFDKAYLVSAGTEATEAALKIMRLNSNKIKKRKPGIICFEGNWHGRTMGAQLLSGNEQQKNWIGFRDPNIYHIKFPYPWDKGSNSKSFLNEELKKLKDKHSIDFKKDICGFMLETFQGWGAIFYPNFIVKQIEQFCKSNDILLCFDEMQAGFARTGKKFGFMHYKVKPDLICIGKGMGSGFPLSGVLGKKNLMDLAPIGSMSSTHSANPISCVAGLATLEQIEKLDLVNKSKDLGIIIGNRLKKLKAKYKHYIKHISVKGCIAAIVFMDKDSNPLTNIANEISDQCLLKGLLVVKTNRESIKIGPPLIIKKKNLLKGLNILEEAMKTVLN